MPCFSLFHPISFAIHSISISCYLFFHCDTLSTSYIQHIYMCYYCFNCLLLFNFREMYPSTLTVHHVLGSPVQYLLIHWWWWLLLLLLRDIRWGRCGLGVLGWGLRQIRLLFGWMHNEQGFLHSFYDNFKINI